MCTKRKWLLWDGLAIESLWSTISGIVPQRNISFRGEKETKLVSSEWVGVKEKCVLHNLCAAVKTHDFFCTCITPWSLSSSQTLALLPYYSPCVHMSHSCILSTPSVTLSVICFLFLFILFHVVTGMACGWMSEARNWNQIKRRQNRERETQRKSLDEWKDEMGEHWEKGAKNALW